MRAVQRAKDFGKMQGKFEYLELEWSISELRYLRCQWTISEFEYLKYLKV